MLIAGTKTALRDLAQRWKALDDEVKILNKQIEALVKHAAPELLELPGVGIEIAGQFLITAGDNPERIHSEAAFAKLCGVAPQPASSGRTTGRHRLSRSGDRAANSALYIVTIVRMRHHQPTRDYFERRTAEGRTKREIIRCVKRYIAREIHQNLPPAIRLQADPDAPAKPLDKHRSIERFQQTMKKWLRQQPPANTIGELQTQIDTFVEYYNHQRPHHSLPHRSTPAVAYTTRPKAEPGRHQPNTEFRVRHDRINDGKVSLRVNGQLHHVGLSRTLDGTNIIMLIVGYNTRIIHAATGEIIRTLTINPDRRYHGTGAKIGGPRRPYGPRKNKKPEP